MERLPVLASPYTSDTFPYLPEQAVGAKVSFKEWLKVFRKSTPTFTEHCLNAYHKDGNPEDGARQFTEDFNKILDALDNDPHAEVPGYDVQPFSCIQLCVAREQCLVRAGFTDIFLSVKREEDEAALPILPGVLQELDSENDIRKRLMLAVQGVFAGNIFDLGAAASAAHYQERKARRAANANHGNGSNNGNNNGNNNGDAPCEEKSDFALTRDKLHPRPWLIDDLDLFLDRLISSDASPSPTAEGTVRQAARYDKAVLFVDNAGPDVLLGMMPFARELLKLGVEVVVTANELPSINDITAAELNALLPRIAEADAGAEFTGEEGHGVFRRAMDAGRFRVVSSGNGLPVIDLSKISPALAAECAPPAAVPEKLLLVLEGMGRSIETNLRAKFTCDALNLGMVKHPEVALELGGKMYDCVCRFRAGSSA